MIFVKAYFKRNLGDDLFVKILLDRYKDKKFITIAPDCYKEILPSNIVIKKNRRIINAVLKKITNNKYDLSHKYIDKSDFTVLIGGSMFIQSKNKKYKRNNYYGKKYYILGSNFGPYYDEKFYDEYLNIFKYAEDVCFREKKSYDLFTSLKNVRWAPDVIFSLDTSNIKFTDNRKVIISVIDCKRKIGEQYEKIYEEKILDLIYFLISKDYNICLMSFCKDEGDEEAINKILEKIDYEKRKNVNKYFYNGKIEEALNILGDSQIVIGSRFHANILGLLLNKVVLPIAYSDKMLNVLKDIEFNGKIIDIRNMNEFNVDEITEKDLNYKKNVEMYVTNAQKQFIKLDEEMERI